MILIRVVHHSDTPIDEIASRSRPIRDYQQCFGAVDRNDQFDTSEFEELVFLAEVREVTHDQEKRLLAKVNQYSRIGRLLGAISSMEVSE